MGLTGARAETGGNMNTPFLADLPFFMPCFALIFREGGREGYNGTISLFHVMTVRHRSHIHTKHCYTGKLAFHSVFAAN